MGKLILLAVLVVRVFGADQKTLYDEATNTSQAWAMQEWKHRSALWLALRTRVLTAKELAEVGKLGDEINMSPWGETYREEEKSAQRHNALMIQQMLQESAARGRRCK